MCYCIVAGAEIDLASSNTRDIAKSTSSLRCRFALCAGGRGSFLSATRSSSNGLMKICTCDIAKSTSSVKQSFSGIVLDQ